MANFNLNKVILGGRLTADPELKSTPNGVSVTSFGLAVTRRYGGGGGEKAPTDFINVTAWRATAEFITRYFKKGSSLCIVGTIQTRSYTDKNGQKRTATEIIADEAYFVDSKGDSVPRQPDASAYVPDNYMQGAPNFEEVPEDGELPF